MKLCAPSNGCETRPVKGDPPTPVATGHTPAAIYWHLQQIYQKHSISRQADLVRLVLSLAELG